MTAHVAFWPTFLSLLLGGVGKKQPVSSSTRCEDTADEDGGISKRRFAVAFTTGVELTATWVSAPSACSLDKTLRSRPFQRSPLEKIANLVYGGEISQSNQTTKPRFRLLKKPSRHTCTGHQQLFEDHFASPSQHR